MTGRHRPERDLRGPSATSPAPVLSPQPTIAGVDVDRVALRWRPDETVTFTPDTYIPARDEALGMMVLGITGSSDSGRTTPVERVTDRLSEDGTVATIAHPNSEPEIDSAGNDRARRRDAGVLSTFTERVRTRDGPDDPVDHGDRPPRQRFDVVREAFTDHDPGVRLCMVSDRDSTPAGEFLVGLLAASGPQEDVFGSFEVDGGGPDEWVLAVERP